MNKRILLFIFIFLISCNHNNNKSAGNDNNNPPKPKIIITEDMLSVSQKETIMKLDSNTHYSISLSGNSNNPNGTKYFITAKIKNVQDNEPKDLSKYIKLSQDSIVDKGSIEVTLNTSHAASFHGHIEFYVNDIKQNASNEVYVAERTVQFIDDSQYNITAPGHEGTVTATYSSSLGKDDSPNLKYHVVPASTQENLIKVTTPECSGSKNQCTVSYIVLKKPLTKTHKKLKDINILQLKANDDFLSANPEKSIWSCNNKVFGFISHAVPSSGDKPVANIVYYCNPDGDDSSTLNLNSDFSNFINMPKTITLSNDDNIKTIPFTFDSAKSATIEAKSIPVNISDDSKSITDEMTIYRNIPLITFKIADFQNIRKTLKGSTIKIHNGGGSRTIVANISNVPPFFQFPFSIKLKSNVKNIGFENDYDTEQLTFDNLNDTKYFNITAHNIEPGIQTNIIAKADDNEDYAINNDFALEILPQPKITVTPDHINVLNELSVPIHKHFYVFLTGTQDENDDMKLCYSIRSEKSCPCKFGSTKQECKIMFNVNSPVDFSGNTINIETEDNIFLDRVMLRNVPEGKRIPIYLRMVADGKIIKEINTNSSYPVLGLTATGDPEPDADTIFDEHDLVIYANQAHYPDIADLSIFNYNLQTVNSSEDYVIKDFSIKLDYYLAETPGVNTMTCTFHNWNTVTVETEDVICKDDKTEHVFNTAMRKLNQGTWYLLFEGANPTKIKK